MECRECHHFKATGHSVFESKENFVYEIGQCRNPTSLYYFRISIPSWRVCGEFVNRGEYIAPPKPVLRINPKKVKRVPKPKKPKKRIQKGLFQ